MPSAREPPDLVAAIEAGDVDPVYLLHGEESHLVGRVVAALRAAVLGGKAAAPGLNHDVFEAREGGLGPAVAAARTLPMFAKRRLVVVNGVGGLTAEALEPLARYVADPNPRTCLVLVAEKVDGRLRAVQALKKAGFVHEFPRLRGSDVPAWLAREARSRGIALAPGVAEALAEAAGPELGRLALALEQVALYAGGGAKVTREHVEELIPESRERGIFELTRAIGQGDRERALRMVSNMLRNRTPPLVIEFMLARQVRQIWRAKELAARGASPDDIAAQIGVPPFAVKELLAPARRASAPALLRALERLYEADRRLKSSRVDADVLVTRLVRGLVEDLAG
jgi:DNA polymerase-3 subunit delta